MNLDIISWMPAVPKPLKLDHGDRHDKLENRFAKMPREKRKFSLTLKLRSQWKPARV